MQRAPQVARAQTARRYWLPDIDKHKVVALRFLPQAEYEQAAPLDVSPAPDVVTRVFLLFQGLKDEEVDTWRALSNTKLYENPAAWKHVVGVKESAWNEGLFRVLEWGGMQVY